MTLSPGEGGGGQQVMIVIIIFENDDESGRPLKGKRLLCKMFKKQKWEMAKIVIVHYKESGS